MAGRRGRVVGVMRCGEEIVGKRERKSIVEKLMRKKNE